MPILQSVRECRLAAACLFLAGLLFSSISSAAVLTSDLEVHLLKSVSTAWQTVPLSNSYTSAIPICTYNLISFSGSFPNYDYPPAVVRIRNITANSFDIRIQGWENSAAATSNVHCIVSDEGAYTLPDGTRYEAHTVLSDATNGQFATDGAWNLSLMEDVSASISQTYTNHVVLGQVISYNDSRASTFFTTDCDARQNEPFRDGHADGICVGKQIGMNAGSRSDETLGYLVAEAGSGTVNNIIFELDRGADSVGGNNVANLGDPYVLSRDYNIGVNTLVGMDGGNGGWAVLYGADPLPPNQIISAIDEDIFAVDTTRNHTNEPVDYWVFGVSELTLIKKVINDSGGTAVESDFKLGAFGSQNISGLTGDDEITEVSVAPGNYSLDEGGPSGYTGTWSCTAGTLVGNTLTLNAGDEAVCTLTNDDNVVVLKEAFLTLEKKVVNDNGGDAVITDFNLSFDGPGIAGSGVSGDAAITGVLVPPGVYNLDELVVPGYTLLEIACSGIDTNGKDGLNIAAGENVKCVFVNDDKGVDLEVVKLVSDSSPNVGDVVTFTIKVKNSGPDTANDVHITDVVLPGFSYVSASMTGGDTRVDTSPVGTGLDWGIATLAVGTTVTLTFQATVTAP